MTQIVQVKVLDEILKIEMLNREEQEIWRATYAADFAMQVNRGFDFPVGGAIETADAAIRALRQYREAHPAAGLVVR